MSPSAEPNSPSLFGDWREQPKPSPELYPTPLSPAAELERAAWAAPPDGYLPQDFVCPAQSFRVLWITDRAQSYTPILQVDGHPDTPSGHRGRVFLWYWQDDDDWRAQQLEFTRGLDVWVGDASTQIAAGKLNHPHSSEAATDVTIYRSVAYASRGHGVQSAVGPGKPVQ